MRKRPELGFLAVLLILGSAACDRARSVPDRGSPAATAAGAIQAMARGDFEALAAFAHPRDGQRSQALDTTHTNHERNLFFDLEIAHQRRIARAVLQQPAVCRHRVVDTGRRAVSNLLALKREPVHFLVAQTQCVMHIDGPDNCNCNCRRTAKPHGASSMV